jgi:peptide/nickel transport system substrate-binding protein
MPINPALKKRLKTVLAGIYFLALVAVGSYLFFGNQVSLLVNYLLPPKILHNVGERLEIGYAFKPSSLEPTLFDPVTRSYLADVYEGLVMTDRDLKLKPALAVSWGLMDPVTWEFRMRSGVKFHNGIPVTTKDVVASIERARNFSGSQLKTLLNTVESVQALDAERIRIRTKVPDPLLLNKMAVTYIFPEGYSDFEKPLGTGPYLVATVETFKMELSRNRDYWGEKPFYQQVALQYIPNRADRIAALEKDEIQLLVNMPPNYACSRTEKYKDQEGCMKLKNPDIAIKSIPSLEVSFIAFNQKNNIFAKREVRSAIALAVDRQTFVDLAFGFARTAGQFVSNGVFGFNPSIGKPECDLETAKQQTEAACAGIFESLDVTFDYPEDLQTVGQYVQSTLNDLGITVTLNPLDNLGLLQKITGGESDFYFLGWRSELGDASDFLQAVAHTKDTARGYGLYNGANYGNPKVDELIEKSSENLDAEKRLKQLQEAMKILVDDDIYGIPLFESETIFAFNKVLKFEPRVDGYIHASEIK